MDKVRHDCILPTLRRKVWKRYTGMHLPEQTEIALRIEGTPERQGIFTSGPGACMAPKLDFPFTSPDVLVIEGILDEKYLEALRQDVT